MKTTERMIRFGVKLLPVMMLALLLCGCKTFKEAWEEALDPDAVLTEDPNNEMYKPQNVVGIFELVRYPRASELEKQIEGLNGELVWINTNQAFSSKHIKEAVVVPRPGAPDICDLQFKVDKLGKHLWQILSGRFSGVPVAMVVDSVYYGSFIPEPIGGRKGDWITIRIGINPYTAKAIAKFAPKNYVYYHPETSSWF